MCHDSLLEYCQGGAPDVASQTSLAGDPSLTTIISWGCVTILGGVRTFTTLQNSSQLTTTDLDGVVELGEVEGWYVARVDPGIRAAHWADHQVVPVPHTLQAVSLKKIFLNKYMQGNQKIAWKIKHWFLYWPTLLFYLFIYFYIIYFYLFVYLFIIAVINPQWG